MTGLVLSLVPGSFVPAKMFAQTQTTPVPEKSRTRRVTDSEQPAPTPTPPVSTKDENPQDSDEVVRVETNLTSIFFTAADSSKRFINNVKKRIFKYWKMVSLRRYSPFSKILIYLFR